MYTFLSIRVLGYKLLKWTPDTENKFIQRVSELPQSLEKRVEKRTREKKGGGGGERRGRREAVGNTLKLCHRSSLGKVLLTTTDHQT